MTITKFLLSTVILIFYTAALVADAPKVDDKDDVKKLQGTWRATKWIDHSEQPATKDELKEFTLEFKGNNVIFGRQKGSCPVADDTSKSKRIYTRFLPNENTELTGPASRQFKSQSLSSRRGN